MKKILNILSLLSLTTTISSPIISCDVSSMIWTLGTFEYKAADMLNKWGDGETPESIANEKGLKEDEIFNQFYTDEIAKWGYDISNGSTYLSKVLCNDPKYLDTFNSNNTVKSNEYLDFNFQTVYINLAFNFHELNLNLDLDEDKKIALDMATKLDELDITLVVLKDTAIDNSIDWYSKETLARLANRETNLGGVMYYRITLEANTSA
ncbi:lipoprotein [Spiroplasma endosymbiont of Labia minor]|uniref:lipoprotein n=1 Tax=Spiroplasma endosymbiont of Labia minor TaxID=3066305 RepID=UPI0030D3494B